MSPPHRRYSFGCRRSHLLRPPRRSPKPLHRRQPSRSAPSTTSLRHPLLHSPVKPPCLLPLRCSSSIVPPCRRRPRASMHTGHWVKPPPSCCHARAPLGRHSRWSTPVPRHRRVSSLDRHAPAAGPPYCRFVARCARPTDKAVGHTRVVPAGRAGAVPLGRKPIQPIGLCFVFQFSEYIQIFAN
jgi:hypothetical protein